MFFRLCRVFGLFGTFEFFVLNASALQTLASDDLQSGVVWTASNPIHRRFVDLLPSGRWARSRWRRLPRRRRRRRRQQSRTRSWKRSWNSPGVLRCVKTYSNGGPKVSQSSVDRGYLNDRCQGFVSATTNPRPWCNTKADPVPSWRRCKPTSSSTSSTTSRSTTIGKT